MKLMAQQGRARWHVLAPERIYTGAGAACGAETWGVTRNVRDVPTEERCRTAACRRLWPAALRSAG